MAKAKRTDRYYFVKSMAEMYDDLPDGAYFAVMDENGISFDELIKYGDLMAEDWEADRAKKAKKKAKARA